jgi:Protein of unknown function (DUF3102)
MSGTELVRKGFDYSQVDTDLAAQMREAADRVRARMRASIIEVGHELLAIKDRLGHGQFVAWVEHECQLNIRAAQRAMQAAEMVDKHDKLSYLPPDGLLALASRSASEPIVAKIIEQIETGAQPTAADIKRQIAAAVREAEAERLGQTPAREEPSPEVQLAALLDAWERAGCEVRRGFLNRIGAVLAAAAQIEEPKQQLTALSEPRVAGPEQLDDDGQTITARIAEPEQLLAASLGVIARRSGCEETGVEDATSPLTEELEQHPAASADPIVATSASWNVGGPQQPEATPLKKSWVGLTSPPEVTCHRKDGACRYGGCARSGRCLHELGYQRAAA